MDNRKTPFMIAEMSGNHNQSIEKAYKLIDQAKEAGADAVKIQTYTADTITIKSQRSEFFINDENSLWYGKSLYELYELAHTPWDWHKELFEYARSNGITLFSSPFDRTAIDFLEQLGNPIYKIASFELMDLDLISYAASTGKPLIMSTGVATLGEISEAVNVALKKGSGDVTLLHCISSYPASPSNYNVKTIEALKKTFGLPVGISDHSLGTAVSVAAVALGATTVEKHFVLDRSEGGVDSDFSLEPQEFKALTNDCRMAAASLGEVSLRLSVDENPGQRQFSRSLYVVKDIKRGEVLTRENIRSIRPGIGLHPRNLEKCLGRIARADLEKGTPLSINHFEDRNG